MSTNEYQWVQMSTKKYKLILLSLNDNKWVQMSTNYSHLWNLIPELDTFNILYYSATVITRKQ